MTDTEESAKLTPSCTLDLGKLETFRERCIGKGATAKVYVGNYGGVPVAVKCVLADRATGFKKELQLLIRINLHHDNVVNILGYDSGIDMRICMELAFSSLHKLLKFSRPLDLEWILWVLHDTCEGMDYLHGKEVIHRDLKPDNLLLFADGKVKITDFGTARLLADRISFSAEIGSPKYWAPEVKNGSCSYSYMCDVWSFGIIVGEVLRSDVSLDVLDTLSLEEEWEAKLKGLSTESRHIFQKRKLEALIHLRRRTFPSLDLQDIPAINIFSEKVEQCLAVNPNNRPSFGELKTFFNENFMSTFSEPRPALPRAFVAHIEQKRKLLVDQESLPSVVRNLKSSYKSKGVKYITLSRYGKFDTEEMVQPELFAEDTSFPAKLLWQNLTHMKQFIIYGPAGAGKTVLLDYFCYTWAVDQTSSRIRTLAAFDAVISVSLTSIDWNTTTTIDDFLDAVANYYGDSSRQSSWIKENAHSVLWLLDDVDKVIHVPVVCEICERRVPWMSNLILFSTDIPEVKGKVKGLTSIQLKKWTDAQQKQFVTNFIPEFAVEAWNWLNSADAKRVKEMVDVPIILELICRGLVEDQPWTKNSTDVTFCYCVNLCVDIMINEAWKKSVSSTRSSLKKLAWANHTQKQVKIDDSYYKFLASVKLLVTEKERLKFINPVFQDFFVAEEVADRLKSVTDLLDDLKLPLFREGHIPSFVAWNLRNDPKAMSLWREIIHDGSLESELQLESPGDIVVWRKKQKHELEVQLRCLDENPEGFKDSFEQWITEHLSISPSYLAPEMSKVLLSTLCNWTTELFPIIELVVQHHISNDFPTPVLTRCLVMAASQNYVQTVILLLQYVPVAGSAFTMACSKSHISCLARFLEEDIENPVPGIQAACRVGNEDVIRMLQERGMKVWKGFPDACGTGNVTLVHQLLDSATKAGSKVDIEGAMEKIGTLKDVEKIPLILDLLISLGGELQYAINLSIRHGNKAFLEYLTTSNRKFDLVSAISSCRFGILRIDILDYLLSLATKEDIAAVCSTVDLNWSLPAMEYFLEKKLPLNLSPSLAIFFAEKAAAVGSRNLVERLMLLSPTKKRVEMIVIACKAKNIDVITFLVDQPWCGKQERIQALKELSSWNEWPEIKVWLRGPSVNIPTVPVEEKPAILGVLKRYMIAFADFCHNPLDKVSRIRLFNELTPFLNVNGPGLVFLDLNKFVSILKRNAGDFKEWDQELDGLGDLEDMLVTPIRRCIKVIANHLKKISERPVISFLNFVQFIPHFSFLNEFTTFTVGQALDLAGSMIPGYSPKKIIEMYEFMGKKSASILQQVLRLKLDDVIWLGFCFAKEAIEHPIIMAIVEVGANSIMRVADHSHVYTEYETGIRLAVSTAQNILENPTYMTGVSNLAEHLFRGPVRSRSRQPEPERTKNDHPAGVSRREALKTLEALVSDYDTLEADNLSLKCEVKECKAALRELQIQNEILQARIKETVPEEPESELRTAIGRGDLAEICRITAQKDSCSLDFNFLDTILMVPVSPTKMLAILNHFVKQLSL
jgi:serine/threonine protein kinase